MTVCIGPLTLGQVILAAWLAGSLGFGIYLSWKDKG